MWKKLLFRLLQKLAEIAPFHNSLKAFWSSGKIPVFWHPILTSTLPDGNKLMLPWPSQVQTIIDDIYKWRAYDRLWEAEEGFTVLDVGAYIGVYTLKTAKRVGAQGSVVAVEPEEENFRLLQRNVEINGYNNIVAVRMALSDFEGRGSLYLAVSGSGEHSIVRERGRKVEVPVSTVDNLMQKLGIDRLDLMKIDVEGAEMQVLRGSEKALRNRNISRIVAAVYHYPNEHEEVSAFLRAFNYKVILVDLTIGCYLHAECGLHA